MKLKKIIALLALCFAAIAAIALGLHTLFSLNPSFAFQVLNEHALPSGVTAQGYGTTMTDTLGKQSHFWELHHTDEGLKLFLQQSGLQETFAEAIWSLPDVEKALGKKIATDSITKEYRGYDKFLLVDSSASISYYGIH